MRHVNKQNLFLCILLLFFLFSEIQKRKQIQKISEKRNILNEEIKESEAEKIADIDYYTTLDTTSKKQSGIIENIGNNNKELMNTNNNNQFLLQSCLNLTKGLSGGVSDLKADNQRITKVIHDLDYEIRLLQENIKRMLYPVEEYPVTPNAIAKAPENLNTLDEENVNDPNFDDYDDHDYDNYLDGADLHFVNEETLLDLNLR